MDDQREKKKKTNSTTLKHTHRELRIENGREEKEQKLLFIRRITGDDTN